MDDSFLEALGEAVQAVEGLDAANELEYRGLVRLRFRIEFCPGQYENVVVHGIGATHVAGRALRAFKVLVAAYGHQYGHKVTSKQLDVRGKAEGLSRDLAKLKKHNKVLRHIIRSSRNRPGRPAMDEPPGLWWLEWPSRTT